LSRLEKNLASVTIGLQNEIELFQEFAMMVEMGFFVLTGERYQMVIPKKVSLEAVKSAALRLAKTDVDEEWFVRPECLITTVPLSRAKEWQERLRRMDENHRLVDRLLLLDDGTESVLAPNALPAANGGSHA